MNLKSKKWTTGLGVLAAYSAFALSASAQVFDTPPSDFPLVPAPFEEGFASIPPVPTTLNIGDFDSSVKSTVTGAGLNDVAISGIPSFILRPEASLTNRVWTIVHDSGSDTRSLTQTAPSDQVVTSEAELFYTEPSSLEILDLNGDGQNDLALLDATDLLDAEVVVNNNIKLAKSGSGSPARVIGIPGQGSAPFFATSKSLLGQQGPDATAPAAVFLEFSQPAMGIGDFDGDGVSDLAIYDFIIEGNATSDLAAVLQNNGSLGLLPRTDTTLNVPSDVAGQNGGYNVVAGDINGDGITDLAMTFDVINEDAEPGPDRLLAFLGNGDGTFNPEPAVNVAVGDNGNLHGLVLGNFDGNGFLDFALGNVPENTAGPSFGEMVVVLCSPGTPASCTTQTVTPANTVVFNLAAADFDSDGLDDLAVAQLSCPDAGCDLNQISGTVGVYLNQGAGFNDSPDQSLLLGATEVRQLIVQVVAKDIDGCGGPDLAYTGFQVPEPSATPTPALKLSEMASQLKLGGFGAESQFASVAFNANEAPVADAGQGTLTPGGVLVGGEPTCSDPSEDTQAIRWTVLSGTATISDPTAANPLITNASAGAVLQVTCTDACGLSDTDTVTIGGPTLLEGSGFGCSLGLGMASAPSAAWLLGLVGIFPVLALRRRRN